MKKNERGETEGIGWLGWIIIICITAGILGYGPCAKDCGPHPDIGQPKVIQTER